MLHRRCLTRFWVYLGLRINQGSAYISSSEYTSSAYARVLNILGLYWVLNMPGLHRILNMPEYAWTTPEYVCLCLNMMPKSAWMGFVLYFPFVIPFLLNVFSTNSQHHQQNVWWLYCDGQFQYWRKSTKSRAWQAK